MEKEIIFFLVLFVLFSIGFSACLSDQCELNNQCFNSSTCVDLGNTSSWYCLNGTWYSFCPVENLTIDYNIECNLANKLTCNYSNFCTSDDNCSFGYYCNKKVHLCVACPKNNVDIGFFNSYCIDKKCVGFDPDCCLTTENCSLAESLNNQKYYCDEKLNLCRSCSPVQDYECDSNCIGIDPDCCLNDDDCVSGYCDSGRCINKEFRCVVDADCSANEVCIDNQCILSCSGNTLINVETEIYTNFSEVNIPFTIVNPEKNRDKFLIYVTSDNNAKVSYRKEILLDGYETYSDVFTVYVLDNSRIGITYQSINKPNIICTKEIHVYKNKNEVYLTKADTYTIPIFISIISLLLLVIKDAKNQ